MLRFQNRRIVSSFILVIVMFESFSILPSTNGLKKKDAIKAIKATVGIIAIHKLKNMKDDMKEEEKKYIPVPLLPIIALALKIKQEKESQYYIVDGEPKELHFNKFHTTGKQRKKEFKIHW